jgi:hypothetical protein
VSDEAVREGAMTDAGEKLRGRAEVFWNEQPWFRGEIESLEAFGRDELERAAAIANDYAMQMFGEKVDAEDLAVEIATTIRKLKE